MHPSQTGAFKSDTDVAVQTQTVRTIINPLGDDVSLLL